MDTIERQCNVSVYLYHLGEDIIENLDKDPGETKTQISLTFVRAGKNNNDNAKKVYLCCIGGTNHTMLISDVQKFLRRVRAKNFSKKDVGSSEFCLSCMNLIKVDIDHHKKVCESLSYVPSIKMPPKGKKYRFKNFIGLEKPCYVAFLDIEAYTPKLDNSHSKIEEHKFAAARYIITNSAYEIVKEHEIINNDINVCESAVENCLDSMINDYKGLMISSKTIDTPYLTDADLAKFNATNECEVCDYKFKLHKEKHRHHDWYTEPVIENGVIIEGNFVACVCFQCNITFHRNGQTCPFSFTI